MTATRAHTRVVASALLASVALSVALALLLARGAFPEHAVAQEVTYDRAAIATRVPRQLRHAPRPGDAYLEGGRRLFVRYCAPCHGAEGRGDGPASDVMRPRPRDFTSGNFSLRQTRSGELPTDADLFLTVSRGVPGTSMPAWGEGIFRLSEADRWQLVYYVKHLNGTFWDAVSDPYRTPGAGEPRPILQVGAPPPVTPAMIARGRRLYMDQTKGGCARCHGAEGRGDGAAAAEMVDDFDNPVRPYDLTNPWRNKGGTTVSDIYRTLSTGLSGTPMADFMDGVPAEQDRWALAMYAQSLLEPRTVSGDPLVARHVDGPLPEDPDAPAWRDCEPFGLPLMGQYVRAPRWQAPSVDYVSVCALYDDREVAIRIEWHDPFRDDRTGARPQPEGEEPPPDDAGGEAGGEARGDAAAPGPADAPDVGSAYLTVAEADARAAARFIPDTLYVQMPVGRRAPGNAQRPLLLMGDAEHPIDVWTWSALRGGTISEAYSRGNERGYQDRSSSAGRPRGKSRWSAGRWRVVMKRSLTTGDARHQVQLGPGDLVPFDVRVWDGSAGEEGLQSAMSTWRHIYLEAPIPARSYLRGLLAALAGYLVVALAWRRIRRSPAKPAG